MRRRNFLAILGALPGVGWAKAKLDRSPRTFFPQMLKAGDRMEVNFTGLAENRRYVYSLKFGSPCVDDTRRWEIFWVVPDICGHHHPTAEAAERCHAQLMKMVLAAGTGTVFMARPVFMADKPLWLYSGGIHPLRESSAGEAGSRPSVSFRVKRLK